VTPMKKTHFEQVPLDVIKKIVEESARQEKIKTGPEPRESKKKGSEADFSETTPALPCGVGT